MLQFNPHARLFKYRLIAYLKLLEQRRTQIFVIFHDEFHYQQQVRAVSAPTQEIRELLTEVRDHCDLRMIAMQKQATQESVYLEAKNLIPVIDAKVRHYAFANGENGVTRLPLLLQLPEDRNSFNMQSILVALNYEFLLSAKSWGMSKKA